MQPTPALIGAVALMTACGFSETIITAQDYAIDSDVALESALKEVKSIPSDTINVIGDSVKFVKDDTLNAVNGVKAVFEGAAPRETVHEKNGRTVSGAWDVSSEIQQRIYKVSVSTGNLMLAKAADKGARIIDVRPFFDAVEFAEGATAYYLPATQRLIARQTVDNLLLMEDVLAQYQSAQHNLLGRQVEIETKFVEVSQNTLNELGFNWEFLDKDGGDLRLFDNLSLPGQALFEKGLRTASQAINAASDPSSLQISSAVSESLRLSLAIQALEQSDDADVLSAPRVVARDGSTAIIQVGEEEMIPKSFDARNSQTSPYIEHSDWENEMMGVTMEVTPEIREEGLIDLELHPKVVELSGQDSYEIAVDAQVVNNSNNTKSDRPGLVGELPYTRVRELETRVTVADGSTVGMGGLIYDKLETFRDKVPVLGSIPLIGRLFRSEGERSQKRNLMIFVTATQVDINGRRSADMVMSK